MIRAGASGAPGQAPVRATRLELLAALATLVLLAMLYRMLAAAPEADLPPPTAEAVELPMPPPASSNAIAQPPAISASPIALPVQAAAANLVLLGLRRDSRGGGAAILAGPDGVQRSVAVGETISPGIVLIGVGSDFATVARSGLRERVGLSGFESSGGQQPGSAPAYYAPAPQRIPVTPRSTAVRPRGPPTGGGSINFADPSSLPASLTNPPDPPRPAPEAGRKAAGLAL